MECALLLFSQRASETAEESLFIYACNFGWTLTLRVFVDFENLRARSAMSQHFCIMNKVNIFMLQKNSHDCTAESFGVLGLVARY
jgi:hypothetical protein